MACSLGVTLAGGLKGRCVRTPAQVDVSALATAPTFGVVRGSPVPHANEKWAPRLASLGRAAASVVVEILSCVVSDRTRPRSDKNTFAGRHSVCVGCGVGLMSLHAECMEGRQKRSGPDPAAVGAVRGSGGEAWFRPVGADATASLADSLVLRSLAMVGGASIATVATLSPGPRLRVNRFSLRVDERKAGCLTPKRWMTSRPRVVVAAAGARARRYRRMEVEF
nr:hypothetical protein CFP56_11349 [Quercus suber]